MFLLHGFWAHFCCILWFTVRGCPVFVIAKRDRPQVQCTSPSPITHEGQGFAWKKWQNINSCLNTFLFYFDFITFLLDQNNQTLHLYLCLSFLTAYIVFETHFKSTKYRRKRKPIRCLRKTSCQEFCGAHEISKMISRLWS